MTAHPGLHSKSQTVRHYLEKEREKERDREKKTETERKRHRERGISKIEIHLNNISYVAKYTQNIIRSIYKQYTLT